MTDIPYFVLALLLHAQTQGCASTWLAFTEDLHQGLQLRVVPVVSESAKAFRPVALLPLGHCIPARVHIQALEASSKILLPAVCRVRKAKELEGLVASLGALQEENSKLRRALRHYKAEVVVLRGEVLSAHLAQPPQLLAQRASHSPSSVSAAARWRGGAAWQTDGELPQQRSASLPVVGQPLQPGLGKCWQDVNWLRPGSCSLSDPRTSMLRSFSASDLLPATMHDVDGLCIQSASLASRSSAAPPPPSASLLCPPGQGPGQPSTRSSWPHVLGSPAGKTPWLQPGTSQNILLSPTSEPDRGAV